jgi:hypothetical protein
MVTYVVERWRDTSGRFFARHHADTVKVDVTADSEEELEQKTNEAIGEAYRMTGGFTLRWVPMADPHQSPDPSPPGETDNPVA